MDKFLLIFLIILAIIEFFAILYYKRRFQNERKFCLAFKDMLDELMNIMEIDFDTQIDKIINSKEKEDK